MKDKILLVLTGGTICSRTEGNVRTLKGSDFGVMIAEGFMNSDSPFRDHFEFETGKNFNTLSENMSIGIWNDILSSLREKNLEEYSGVIILHGTDTLAYTAALFSLMLTGINTPFFLVSSNAPLDQGEDIANGSANFKAALELIGSGIKPGVYVTYRNISDKKMYLHLASRLRQSENYSDDFESAGMIHLEGTGTYDTEAINEEFCIPEFKGTPLLYLTKDHPLENAVLKIEPYVGMNYGAYDYSRFRAVLHGSFHSGTACVEKTEDNNNYSDASVLHMIDRCRELGVKVYFSPVKLTGEIYDTVPIMASHAESYARMLYGCTKEFDYARLLILYSNPDNEEELKKILFSGSFGENFA